MGQIFSKIFSSDASRLSTQFDSPGELAGASAECSGLEPPPSSSMAEIDQEQLLTTQITEAVEEMASKWNTSLGDGVQRGDIHPVEVPDYLRIDPCDIKKVRHIGSGGSAEVYEATWSRCPCAVKRFTSEYSRGWVSLVQQELNYLIALRHPHVVRLMGLSVDSHQRCSIVMELMSNSLRDLIVSRMQEKEKKSWFQSSFSHSTPIVPFKFSEAVDIVMKIALGMWFLHTKGVAHRDLKSANVLVQDIGGDIAAVKIVDFGVSLNLDSNGVQAVCIVGTGFFMAPEILQLKTDKSKKPDLMAADVYSFAMTCYEVLTGKLPFQDEQLKPNEYDKVTKDRLRPKLPENLDNDLTSLIESCWAHDPNDRPKLENICEQLLRMRAKTSSGNDLPFNCLVRAFTGNEMRHLSSAWQDDEFISLFWDEDNDQQASQRVLFKLKDRLLTIIDLNDLTNPQRIFLDRRRWPTEVYKATWLGCTFAVKKLEPRFTYEEEAQELEFYIRLCHPHIVQLMGVSSGPHQELMIVMELMDCNLRELIDSRMQDRWVWPFDLREPVLIIRQIALGMAFLHSRGVMHRDLKSHNVLVKELRGHIEVKIADFGLSRYLNQGETREDYGGTGTSFWRAPEILHSLHESREARGQGKPFLKAFEYVYTFKADVYAFAMTCYEVLTGEIPLLDVMPNHYHVVIDGRRPTLPSDLTADLKALIEKCWHGEPEQRPDFAYICQEIQRIEEELPISTS